MLFYSSILCKSIGNKKNLHICKSLTQYTMANLSIQCTSPHESATSYQHPLLHWSFCSRKYIDIITLPLSKGELVL